MSSPEFPEINGNGWRHYHVLEAQDMLERLPEKDRAPAIGITDGPGIPPRTAINILVTLAAMPVATRREVFELYRSEDPRDVSLAISRSTGLPPIPDPRLAATRELIRSIKKMLQYLARSIDRRTDHHTEPLQHIIDLTKAELKLLEKEWAEFRRAEQRAQLAWLVPASTREGNEALKPRAEEIRTVRDRFAERDAAVGPTEFV